LQIVCLDWLWTMILLISPSQVGRITGVSHQHPTILVFLILFFSLLFFPLFLRRRHLEWFLCSDSLVEIEMFYCQHFVNKIHNICFTFSKVWTLLRKNKL
jgi:hypothetical protein